MGKRRAMYAKRCTGAREHDRTPRSSFSDSVLQIYAILSAPSILSHRRPESTRCPTILCLCLSSCLSLLPAMPLLRPRFSVAPTATSRYFEHFGASYYTRFNRTLIKKRIYPIARIFCDRNITCQRLELMSDYLKIQECQIKEGDCEEN